VERTETERLDAREDLARLVGGGRGFQHDDHGLSWRLRGKKKPAAVSPRRARMVSLVVAYVPAHTSAPSRLSLRQGHQMNARD